MSKIQNGCLLFSSIGSRTPFPHSMSGPRSCVCSQVGACTVLYCTVLYCTVLYRLEPAARTRRTPTSWSWCWGWSRSSAACSCVLATSAAASTPGTMPVRRSPTRASS